MGFSFSIWWRTASGGEPVADVRPAQDFLPCGVFSSHPFVSAGSDFSLASRLQPGLGREQKVNVFMGLADKWPLAKRHDLLMRAAQ